MSPEAQAALDETTKTIELAASEEAADLVDTMVDDLGLWASRVEAGLFLVALAVTRGEDPVPADERGAAEETLGSLEEAEGDLDHLAILGVVDDQTRELEETLASQLPGWVEAGAGLLGPRLEGADAVDATAELAEIVREIG